MSKRFSDLLFPPGHELENLTRRMRRPKFDSSVRSRSVPDIRGGVRSDDDGRASPLICAQDYENSNAEVPVHIDDPEEISHVDSIGHDAATSEEKDYGGPGGTARPKDATEGDAILLSIQRSHSRRDTDEQSDTETIVPRRNLTVLDVASLILNKMVGTSPSVEPCAVARWRHIHAAIVGRPTSVFSPVPDENHSILVYLEFGSALPFNGGELIYLDEVYPTPELLSTILFAAFFLCLGNSYGNAVTFAKQTILASDPSANRMSDLDTRLVRFIAVAVLSVVCLLHYFSNRFGLFMNKLFAMFKTVLLLTVFIAGMKASTKDGSGLADFGKNQGSRGAADGLSAMVLIFYAYQGWENANYAFGSSLGLKVCIALSAFGNLLAVTFTSSKVKQAIAVQRIIPFYKFFQKDINTPKGALVLHWLSSTLLIIFCPVSADGYTFAVGLFTYGHIIIGTMVTLGLYRLTARMQQTWPGWRPMIFTNKLVRYTLPVVFTVGNLIILIWGAKPRDSGKIPRFWWPVTFFLIIAGGVLYWACLVATQVKIIHRGKETTIGKVIGFQVKIYNETDEVVPPNMEEAIVQSRLDGSRRRVGYQVRSPPPSPRRGRFIKLTYGSSLGHSQRRADGTGERRISSAGSCFEQTHGEG
ncbi:hypothetical protein LTR67_004515 [Exophiala xenobiotica]